MMAEIIVAQGICSAIRPKLLTALGPYGFKNLQIQAWAQDEDGTNRRSDEDSLAPLHVAQITVSDQAAEWCEYLICRYSAAYPGFGFRLMSKPINPKNQRWAAKWNTLPKAWRQEGCTVKLQPEPGKKGQPAQRQLVQQQPQQPKVRQAKRRQPKARTPTLVDKLRNWIG